MPINFGHRNTGKHDGSTPDAWWKYTCGHCGTDVSGAVIAYTTDERGVMRIRWLQCPTCHNGSVQAADEAVHPGVPFGPVLQGLPAATEAAYSEARRCLAVNANTAAEVMCRKILMHVAVDKGAKEGDTFASYIDYLQQQGYVTPPMQGWVTLIKEHGNLANHRLDPPDRKRAEGTLLFTVQLLRSVYEMGFIAAQFTPPTGQGRGGGGGAS